ncbi:putative aspartic-type endopeptidase OPSB [Beauveria bassiana]|uniref:Putative aspartic-type endopeptidase OPSB n=1 Tax=Beauveria bassiana TaxID=176275 RepID=A0A2N6NM72_BEABA|nr:putative aspartic-type endopeptidase OPSB [Beauveria bassiana]
MRHDWQHLSLLLASDVVVAQRVLQGSVQHFQSDAAGPWQPLLSLGFGTPPQEIVGIFDTGSSDTIIPKAGSELCQVNNQQCTEPAPVVLGEFDPEVASDVKELKGETFDAGFSGGDEFNGEYIETTISVGGDGGGEIPGAQVALASGGQPSGDFPQFSIFGTGPREAEATDQKYDNLPQIMKNAGVVKGNSYSVVMNPTPLANGSVFFGGIDRSKFSGELQKVAIDRDDSGKISDYVVKMTSLKLDMGGSSNKTAKLTKNQKRAHRSLLRRGVRRRSIRQRVGTKAKGTYGGGRVSTQSAEDEDDGENGGNKNGGNKNGGNATTPGLIDLGLKKKETFTLFDTGGVDLQLPAGVLRKMARALDANFSEEDGLGPVECDKLSADNKLVLGFNNDKVKATMALDKIRVSEDIADPELTRAGLCEVGVSAVDPSTNLNSIGFGFFTDVYTVFDLESNSLWFAQAKGDPSAPGAQLEEFP